MHPTDALSFTANEKLQRERDRMVAELRRRDHELDPSLYKRWNPAVQLAHGGVYRDSVQMLYRAGVFPKPGQACLEIGYGTRGWLPQLLDWGLHMTDLHGIELDEVHAQQAKAVLPQADLRVGNAAQLPWPDHSFHLVVAMTVFTSILDEDVRRQAANEVVRVLKPGGALLWHDFALNNPSNPNVRKVTRRELRALFPTLHGKIKSHELAPPLARRIAPISWTLATLLERSVPFFRTHLMAVLVKPS